MKSWEMTERTEHAEGREQLQPDETKPPSEAPEENGLWTSNRFMLRKRSSLSWCVLLASAISLSAGNHVTQELGPPAANDPPP